MSNLNEGELVITLSSTEKTYPYDRLSITHDMSDQEILDAVAPVVLEEEGFNIKEEQEDGYFTVKRVDSPGNKIFIFPKSTAGV